MQTHENGPFGVLVEISGAVLVANPLASSVLSEQQAAVTETYKVAIHIGRLASMQHELPVTRIDQVL